MKHCFKCGLTKNESEFYCHPMMADGLLGKCKECARSDVTDNRRRKAVQYSQYDAMRFQKPDRRAQVGEAQKRMRLKHPEKYAARAAINDAIRSGKLKRMPCEVDGCTRKAQAHHSDYSKHFDVRWLCFVHHREIEHQQIVVRKEIQKHQ